MYISQMLLHRYCTCIFVSIHLLNLCHVEKESGHSFICSSAVGTFQQLSLIWTHLPRRQSITHTHGQKNEAFQATFSYRLAPSKHMKQSRTDFTFLDESALLQNILNGNRLYGWLPQAQTMPYKRKSPPEKRTEHQKI